MTYTPPSKNFLKNRTGTDSSVIAEEFAKVATEIGNDQALASGKIIVGNASGVATDVTMSGDATLSNAGALTIAAEAVTLAKSADLARGSLISGQTADNRPTALDAKGSGKILVGDGTDVNSVSVSGDVTLATTGAVTIAAGAVDEAMLSGYGVDGLHTKRIARATYDFAVDGGAVGDIGLGVTLPDNAIITRSWYSVLAGLTSADSTATVALSVPTDDVAGIAAATAISTTNWDAGNHEGIQDGAAANFSVQTTAARELTLIIGVQALTAGTLILFCEYVALE